MNLLTAPLTEGGARLAGTVIPLAPAVRVAAARDKLTEIVIGIRPEHMHLADAAGRTAAGGGRRPAGAVRPSRAVRVRSVGAEPGSAVLAGDVVLVEELGADALLHVRLADGGGAVVARTEGRKPPAPGPAGRVPRPVGRRLRVQPGHRRPAGGLSLIPALPIF